MATWMVGFERCWDWAGDRTKRGTTMAENGAGTEAGVIPLHRPHLAQGAFAAQELVDNSAGDAEHGGERQDPADGFPPPRVHVCLVVCQRLVVHHVEHEDALGGEREMRSRGARSWRSPHPPPRVTVAPRPRHACAHSGRRGALGARGTARAGGTRVSPHARWPRSPRRPAVSPQPSTTS